MAVGENGVTLHDLERTMLSLDWDKNLNDGDREFLMKGYKEERMRYMDSLFAFTEEHRRRLEAVVDRMTRREVQKRKQGAVSAKMVRANLEIGNLEDTEEHCYSDEEMDMRGILCGEDREHLLFWGIQYRAEFVDSYKEEKERWSMLARLRIADEETCPDAGARFYPGIQDAEGQPQIGMGRPHADYTVRLDRQAALLMENGYNRNSAGSMKVLSLQN